MFDRPFRGIPRIAAIIAAGLSALAMTGCAYKDAPYPKNPSDPGHAIRIQQAGVVLEYRADLDRVIFFGPVGGPNLLHTVELHRTPADDGSYTFYGGGYSWIAPQRGDFGWTDEAGDPKDWPPDPSVDRGPMRVIERALGSITMQGPVTRSGLREHLTIAFVSTHHVDFIRAIENTTDQPVTAAVWSIAAVRPGDVIALRNAAMANLWSPDNAHVKLFESVAIGCDGWMTIATGNLPWQDGIKVYADSNPVVAVHTQGWWLLRQGVERDDGALRSVGEAPVALYIHPGLGLIEAELYSPLEMIEPGERITFTEHWSLIPSSQPNTDVLP
ncbi:MAG: hypothetical protein KAS72_10440 [Phycisphaerales bacterium]|nr:hypothetical protein [Phycisphaerales bacterium]